MIGSAATSTRVVAEGPLRRPTGDIRALGVVDGGGEVVHVGDVDRGAVGCRDTIAELADASLQEALDLRGRSCGCHR